MVHVKNYFILTSKYDEFFYLKATYFLCLLYLLWFHLCQNCLWNYELKLIIISLTRSYQALTPMRLNWIRIIISSSQNGAI